MQIWNMVRLKKYDNLERKGFIINQIKVDGVGVVEGKEDQKVVDIRKKEMKESKYGVSREKVFKELIEKEGYKEKLKRKKEMDKKVEGKMKIKVKEGEENKQKKIGKDMGKRGIKIMEL